jgi:hypothetical protein
MRAVVFAVFQPPGGDSAAADHGRLLRVLARLLRQIADDLVRIAGG